jgi:ribosomal protein S18 acetylase RimI-like enzyme
VKLTVRALDPDAPPELLSPLESILSAARRHLARRGEHFADLAERLFDAEGDPDRAILFAAAPDGRPAGLVELAFHAPEPGATTIAAIATDPAFRFLGVGRALVRASVEAATGRGADGVFVAGVHASNTGAQAFFESLGFADQGRAAGLITLRATRSDLASRLG